MCLNCITSHKAVMKVEEISSNIKFGIRAQWHVNAIHFSQKTDVIAFTLKMPLHLGKIYKSTTSSANDNGRLHQSIYLRVCVVLSLWWNLSQILGQVHLEQQPQQYVKPIGTLAGTLGIWCSRFYFQPRHMSCDCWEGWGNTKPTKGGTAWLHTWPQSISSV